MLPSIFGEDLFDDWMNDYFPFGKDFDKEFSKALAPTERALRSVDTPIHKNLLPDILSDPLHLHMCTLRRRRAISVYFYIIQ